MDIKNEMVRRLRLDCEKLLKFKIPKALENISDEKGANTYRNLTRALADNIKLIEEYEWKLMWSEYETGDNLQKQVAVWEQNCDEKIRNHKVWNVAGDISSDSFGLVADIIKGFKVDGSNITIKKGSIKLPSGSLIKNEGDKKGGYIEDATNLTTCLIISNATMTRTIYDFSYYISIGYITELEVEIFEKSLKNISKYEEILEKINLINRISRKKVEHYNDEESLLEYGKLLLSTMSNPEIKSV